MKCNMTESRVSFISSINVITQSKCITLLLLLYGKKDMVDKLTTSK